MKTLKLPNGGVALVHIEAMYPRRRRRFHGSILACRRPVWLASAGHYLAKGHTRRAALETLKEQLQ